MLLAVEFSFFVRVAGCGWNITLRVVHVGLSSCPWCNMDTGSASAAGPITFFIIFEISWTEMFVSFYFEVLGSH